MSVSERPRVVFGAPSITDAEIAEVVDTLRSGWIGTGPKTQLFAERFADYVGARFAVPTNSGTAALHLALDALGVGPGDEVITTPLTFVATANVIEHCGATPVFADVRPEDGNVDPDEVDRRRTRRTRALLPVHYAGAVADVEELAACHPDLPIVVDAAHAVEARHGSGATSAGGGALCAAYSFYATKNLSTGEGGMLVTDDAGIARCARTHGLHGLDNDAWDRYSSGRYGSYELERPGFKYNMTDIQAALGLHQLARIEENLVRRRAIWTRYVEAFAGLPGVELPPRALAPDRVGRHSLHLFTLWFDWDALGFGRGELVGRLADAGVGTGWHFRPVHLHRYYRERYGYREGDLPAAEEIGARTVSLPLSPSLDDRAVEHVVDAVHEAVGARELVRDLRPRR